MYVSYKLSAYSKETRKTCDEAIKAYQDCLVEMAKVVSNGSVPLIWLITRFYRVTLTKEEDGYKLTYHFYLFPTPKSKNYEK